nr:protein FAR-RED IMPAIRED RESPONSE 1-like [Lolium perenne]
MGGKEPRLMITDEDASMREAMRFVLITTIHRLCMWHIMKKLPEKISPSLREDPAFFKRVNSCVWGSETPEEFELTWNSFISDFQLEDNEWLATRYKIRESWIPAYFRDIHLAGILRTTSRSESANSFFNRFIGRKLAFVEFWLRFDTALQCQRQEELIADNTSIHTTPQIMTSWEIEKQGSEVFTHEVFDNFQKEVLAAREHCDVQGTEMVDGMKVMAISDASNKVREVQYDTSTMIAKCSCILFESKGIPCRHIIRFLRAAKVENVNEQLSSYVLKRWEKNCKRYSVYDSEGNLLAEKPIDPVEAAKRRKISDARNKFEALVQKAKNYEEGIDFLTTSLLNMEEHLSKLGPAVSVTRQEEHEAFLGCSIPSEVSVLPPTDVRTKGRCKRIKGHGDKGKKNESEKPKAIRKCGKCKQAGHNSRKCLNKNPPTEIA